jgi:hypothetical protein
MRERPAADTKMAHFARPHSAVSEHNVSNRSWERQLHAVEPDRAGTALIFTVADQATVLILLSFASKGEGYAAQPTDMGGYLIAR